MLTDAPSCLVCCLPTLLATYLRPWSGITCCRRWQRRPWRRSLKVGAQHRLRVYRRLQLRQHDEHLHCQRLGRHRVHAVLLHRRLSFCDNVRAAAVLPAIAVHADESLHSHRCRAVWESEVGTRGSPGKCDVRHCRCAKRDSPPRPLLTDVRKSIPCPQNTSSVGPFSAVIPAAART